MIKIQYAPTFIRMYKGLEPALKEEVKEKIVLFRSSKHHVSLKVHKLHGPLNGRFSFSVNYKIRIVFKYVEDGKNKNVVNFLYIGAHEGVY